MKLRLDLLRKLPKTCKNCKIRAGFTKEIEENSKGPYLLNKNVSEALNAFFVVSMFGLFFIVWGPKRPLILNIFLDCIAFP